MKPTNYARSRSLSLRHTKSYNLVFELYDHTVNLFILQSQWKETFPCLISKAATVDVISDGEDPNRNGSVQLVSCSFNLFHGES